MRSAQPGILAAPPALGRLLTFRMLPDSDPRTGLRSLRDGFDVDWGVAGLGEPTLRALHRPLPGLRVFPALAGPGSSVPSTQQALWFFLRGTDRGVLFDLTGRLRSFLDSAFLLDDALDTFTYAGGRDLTGYEDGTENPRGEAAIDAAVVPAGGSPDDELQGSCFVAVQRWHHDLRRFRSFPPERRDRIIGRRADTNDEIGDAPATAHVKRTAQESFAPPAFMLRRSMPWATADQQGLEFVAFVESLDRYERVLRRMVGLDDGIVDALFSFSRPTTGAYYWCPPRSENRLDLSRLDL